jgi:hypothetical protein
MESQRYRFGYVQGIRHNGAFHKKILGIGIPHYYDAMLLSPAAECKPQAIEKQKNHLWINMSGQPNLSCWA